MSGMSCLQDRPPWHRACSAPLRDCLGRRIGYLRLSLTSACPMRCLYCRPKVMKRAVVQTAMTASTIERVVRHLANRFGLRKVRLTGGEPTARPDLLEIVERLARIDGLKDLAMTTNGLTLARDAQALRQAGLHRVNVSLDSLDPTVFARLTGVDGRDRVIAGLHAARAAGLTPIRLNTVVLANENHRELPDLLHFAAKLGEEIRFIELMPMGPLAGQWADRYVPESQMRRQLEPIITRWEPLEQGADSARRYRVCLDNGLRATVGFITPMSCQFCAACDRLRLTANGDVYPCLMDRPQGNILSAVHPRFDAKELETRLRACLREKAEAHPTSGFTTMTILGG